MSAGDGLRVHELDAERNQLQALLTAALVRVNSLVVQLDRARRLIAQHDWMATT